MTARRPLPDDFEQTYLAMGWDGLQYHYGTMNRTIKRWIEEAGGDELRARRAAAVNARRNKKSVKATQPVATIVCDVEPELIKAAAHHLRHPRNGGWFVSQTPQGDWRVGNVRKSGREVLALAKNRGFDPSVIFTRQRA